MGDFILPNESVSRLLFFHWLALLTKFAGQVLDIKV